MRIQIVLGQQSIHCQGMRFEFAAFENVADLDFLFVECRGDQQSSMAIKGLSLCAHDRNALFPGSADQPRDTVSEAFGSGNPLIGDSAILVTRWVIGTAAKFTARKT